MEITIIVKYVYSQMSIIIIKINSIKVVYRLKNVCVLKKYRGREFINEIN